MQHSNGNGSRPQGRKTNPSANKPRMNSSRGKRNTEEYQEKNRRVKERLDWLRNELEGYYTDEVLMSTLNQFKQDPERARQHLLNQRQTSWSYKVKPTSHYQPVAENQSQQTHYQQQTVQENQPQNVKPNFHKKQRKNQYSNNNASVPTSTLTVDEYNDEKIEAIQMALANQLTVVETKAEKLKNLHEEIKGIRADRDTKIGQLVTEKETLMQRYEQLELEIDQNQKRISQIETEVARLKQEKIQKINNLEEESRVLLGDN